MYEGRVNAWSQMDDVEELRERARAIRTATIRDLDGHHARFRAAVERNGGTVTYAADAAAACASVVAICERSGARLAGKSKSMATEEIGLNDALEQAGIRTVETDLGEYILQLAGDHPAHIIGPAIEKPVEDVARVLSEVEGTPLSSDVPVLLQAARRQLREVFETADVGITGVNFGVAETGSLCLVSNEGNARLLTSLPRVHIAIMGMERLVPTTDDLSVMLRLLASSAAGQKLSSYTTLLTGPRRDGEQDGPDEVHVIVLDNGRSKLRGGRYEEMLNCIRCGSCLNVCPIYRKAGGRSYSDVYSGPMGAVLVPLLVGLDQAPSLPHASSLCGACTAACPVKIPLHEMLLDLRQDLVEQRRASRVERLAFSLWSFAWSRPALYRLSTSLARLGLPLARRTGPGRRWATERAIPAPARKRYRDR
jgi:L-lactate dehydrogenase complex protein LldF